MMSRKKLSCAILASFVFVIPVFVGADTYETISGIPGLDAAADASNDFTGFINTIYRMSIGVGAALAVIMIIFSGIQYSTSAVAGKKSELKDRITMSLGGLGLLLGAFVFLEFINPNLTSLNVRGADSLTFNSGTFTPTEAVTIDGTRFESGLVGDAAADDFENPTVAQYEERFGRQPFDGRIVDGRVTLTTQEIQQFLQQFNTSTSADLGVSSPDGTHINDGTPVDTGAVIDVSAEGQQMVAAAIISTCSEIPRSWAGSADLYKVIAKESGGIVGRPNYALESYMNANNISPLRLRQDIRQNTFYQKHCCRIKNSSTIGNRVTDEPGGAQCNPGTQSGLMDHTRAQAAAGVTGYSHIAGQCASAAGIGQLLIVNMKTYQPSGVQGYKNASEEMCGMLKYIQSRYGSPESAWQKYVDGKGY